tara:strand:- start:3485 stop:3856 length:372 start_codon:yes stop_codon:yes gene_type:complete
MDALQTYEVIKNHLLEKKLASTDEEANAIILNMEESWFQQILSEEDADRLRDRRMERGGVGGNQRYDRAPKAPNTKKFGTGKTALQKQMEKKHGKGKSAMDIVRAEIEAKHGKGAIMDTKKKK